jgi:hypothetical protein
MARERVKEGIPPLTQNIAIEALRPGVSGVNPKTPGSSEIPG